MRFGLVGLGQMGRHHARILSDSDEVDFVGAVDPMGDRHRAVRRGAVFETVDQLLDSGIDAAIVAVPTANHFDVSMRLAKEGIHTLIEKPLAESVGAAEEIRDAYGAQGLVAAVGHVERFNSGLQEMKRRLDAGQLGRVISIATERVGPFPSRISDVGVVKDLATHDIDIVTWIGGSPFAEVTGQLAHKMGRPHEDLVVAVGRLENDVVASLNVNWLTPVKRRGVTVLGEKGAFVADLLTGDLRFHSNADLVDSAWDQLAILRGVSEGDTIGYAFPKREPLAVEHEAFRQAVSEGHAEGVVTLEEGVAILRVAESIIGPGI
ncbi:MAG: Gfo/Idh/MocA family oxidoreductase [Acidimicrobiia bacterium]|nr:Gfo/Idh/MocA family oxidoreductase [Acidimicrobiia bacterium]MDH3463303.1 Gfo/Idh/MocA family oxidoreductase [Acidimicrobiia bacterium]